MRNRISLALFAIFFLLLVSVPPSVADETSPTRRTAVESGKEEAASLLRAGKYAEAYVLYMRLLREIPDDGDVNLGLAGAAMRSGRYNQAVMAYERLVDKYPKVAPFYEGLAGAYMALNDRAGAEQALAAMREAGATGAGGMGEALDKLERHYSLFQAHGRVRAGVLYDSNANLGPRSNSMSLGIWRVEARDAKETETFGGYVGAELDLARRFYRDSPWWVVGDAQASFRGNTNNDLGKHDNRTSQWYRTAVGLRHLGAETFFDLRAKAEVFDYEGMKNVSAFGPEGTFLWAATSSVQLMTRAEITRRVYSREPGYNGAYGSLGEYVRLFFGEENHELLFGARYIVAWTKEKDYGYDGWEASAKAVFKLPHGFELTPFVSYTEEFYRGAATALESHDRTDRRWRLGNVLTYRISEAWSVEVMYQYMSNKSRSALYDYDQNMVSTGVAWNF
jgi:Putative Zn-dependent protease, contains TPR repeats